jgi:hypothetical protein
MKTVKHYGLVGFSRKSKENMEDGNIGYNDRQALNGKALRDTSNYIEDWSQPFSWNTDITRELGHEIFDREVPATQGEKRVGSRVKEGASDNVLDEVLSSEKKTN